MGIYRSGILCLALLVISRLNMSSVISLKNVIKFYKSVYFSNQKVIRRWTRVFSTAANNNSSSSSSNNNSIHSGSNIVSSTQKVSTIYSESTNNFSNTKSDHNKKSKSISFTAVEFAESIIAYMQYECQYNFDNSYLLLCVSGGIDSMALLHLIGTIKKYYYPSLTVEVLNFNHKLRHESDEEAQFVSSWADRYGMKFHQCIWSSLNGLPVNTAIDSSNDVDDRIIGMQEKARKWRKHESMLILGEYKRFNPNKNNYMIATAHHADDDTETILMKLLRGVHISNIHGMKPVAGSWIKPLLSVHKEELNEYMLQSNLTWHEDISNQSNKYKRNALRLDVMPHLQQLAGGATALYHRLSSLAQQSDSIKDMLDAQGNEFISKHLPQFANILLNNCDDESEEADEIVNYPNHIDFKVRIDVSNQSPFVKLPAALQVHIIRKICTSFTTMPSSSISSGDISYNRLYKAHKLCTSMLANGVRSKTLEICGDLKAVRYGNFVIFQNISPTTSKDLSSRCAVVSEKHISCDNINVTYPSNLKITILSNATKTYSSSNSTSRPSLLKFPLHCYIHNIPVTKAVDLLIRYPVDGDRFLPIWKTNETMVVGFLRGQGVSSIDRLDCPVILMKNVYHNNFIIAIPPYVNKQYHNDRNITDHKTVFIQIDKI